MTAAGLAVKAPRRLLLLALVALCCTAAAGEAGKLVSRPYRLSPHHAPGDRVGAVKLLGTLALEPAEVSGQRLGGLSGLAWDRDEGRLYALSDRGWLFHLEPELRDDRLIAVRALEAHPLLGADGGRIRDQRARDAEALVARAARNGRRGDTRLAVAFERQVRVAEYDPRGQHLGTVPLPPPLAREASYAGPNAALESLTDHPALGLLTAPERPLADPPAGHSERLLVSIHSLAGMHWDYVLHPAPNAALVDLAALPDGRLASLERAHGPLYLPVIISLRLSRPTAENRGARLATETLVVLDSSQGWSVDNFEGLAWHEGMRFFLVSDDNFNELQRTLLVYLEISGEAGTADGAESRNLNRVMKPGIDMN